MRIPAPLRRATATFATATLALVTLVAGLAAPATAEDVGFSVDDFAGNAMGTRTLVAGNNTCSPSGNNALTMGTGTMKVDARVPDALGCNYANAQVTWTADSVVNLEQAGADRLQLKYRDVTPNQPSAVTFGVSAEDVNGKVASVGGLTRNGGAAGDWLTIRYTPAYVGDVAVFTFPSGFDRSRVKKVTLFVSATTTNQNVSVTFEGIGANVGEPTYVAPAFASTSPLVFPPSTTTTRTVAVTGNPAPDVTMTSGKPSWMNVSTSKSGTTTTVTLTGNPGTSYADTSVTLHADVANALTADATIPVVVPSPVSVTYSALDATVGVAGPTTLGTVTSTPGSTILGPTTGLPAGTGLALVGSDVQLTGTPTATGTFAVATTVGNEYRTASFSRSVVVGQQPTVVTAANERHDVILGEPVSIPITTTGYPAPQVDVTGLPAGLSYSDGAITGTPTLQGARIVTVTATNAWGTGTGTLDLVVGPRPTVTAPTTTLVTAGSATSLPVPLTGDPYEVTATGLPAGLSAVLTGSTAAITGTPARPASAAQATGTATITADNGFATATTTWAWTVQAAPQVTGPATVSTTLGSALTGATLVATGYPSPTLTTTVLGGASLPPGLSLDTSTPGQVKVVGTPTATTASGAVVVRVTADNGVGGAVARDLTIDVLQGPSFADASPELTLRAGTTDSLALAWSGHERPTLALGSALPGWLTFTAATGTFTAAPGAAVSGSFGPFAVTATNAAGTATANVTVVVTAPAALTASVTDVPVRRGTAVGTVDVGLVTGYPAPTVSATGLPSGLGVVVSGGRVLLSGTTNATGGRHDVTVTATNGVGTAATLSFTVVVQVPATLSAPPTVTLPVDTAAVLPITLGGYPAPTLSTTALPAGLTLSGGIVSGTPTSPGTYTVTLSASNGVDTDPTPVPVTIEVTSVPTFASPPSATTLRLGTAVDRAAFTLAGHPTPVADADGLPAGLAIEQTGAAVRLVGTPTQAGTFDVEVTLTSATGTTDAGWTVVVQEPAGVSAAASATLVLGAPMTLIPLTVTGYPAPALTVTGLPAGVTLVEDGDGARLAGTPTRDGRFTAVVTAGNGVGDESSTSIVLDVESAPSAGDDVAARFPAGTASTLTLEPTGHPAPTLTTSPLPAWLTFDAASATFSGTPSEADQGEHEVVVTATNVRGTATATVTLTVPAPPTTTLSGGTTVVRAATAVDVALTPVLGHPEPTATATGLPAGLSVSVSGGELRLTGTTSALGTHDVQVTLDNAVGTALTVPWTLVVQAPPSITAPGQVDVVVGEPLTATVASLGYPAPTVTASGLPAGVTFVPTSSGGRLTGTPTTAGTSTVTFRATNGVGDDATATTTLVVAPAPVPEVEVSTPRIAPGGALEVRVSGLEPHEQARIELHSTPVLLAEVRADADGALVVDVTVPASTPAGTHHVVVMTASGERARVAVEVRAAVPTPDPSASPDPSATPRPTPTSGGRDDQDDELATTGATAGPLVALALLSLALGATALTARRRRS